MQNNHRWLAERLGQSNDFSDTPFFNARHYIDEVVLERTARQKGMQVQRYPGRMLEFTKDDKQVVFHINAPRLPMATHLIGGDKVLLKTLFDAHGIPTPQGKDFTDYDEALAYFLRCTTPQVVKPTNGFASRGVTVHVTTEDVFEAAWHKAREIGETVLVEEMIWGEEVRVYFINGRFISATARTPAFVIGDGKHSIAELIKVKNSERSRNPVTNNALITSTPALERAERNPLEVPVANEWVILGDKNIGVEGAEYIALGNALPDPIVAIAQQAAGLLPSTVCGVDIFVENLANPKNIWITEINSSTPAISGLFHFPRYGEPIEVAPRLIDYALKNLSTSTKPSRVILAAAKRCEIIEDELGDDFVIERLEQCAQGQNIDVERPVSHALLFGNPPKLSWTRNLSSLTAMESITILKHSEWLRPRLQQMGAAKPALAKGHEVRLLIADDKLLAAQVRAHKGWQDATMRLHKNVLEIVARIMHAIYRPGHALITLSLTDLFSDPFKKPWGLNSIDLQPDLRIFYNNVNRARDVIPPLFEHLWKKY